MPPIPHVVGLAGDSLTDGTIYGFNTYSGGLGSWREMLLESIANLTGLAPIGPGLEGFWHDTSGAPFPAGGDGSWTHTGTWTQIAASSPANKGPYGMAFTANAGQTATYHINLHGRPVTNCSVDWIDDAGSGNAQYRVDGGTWLNFNQSRVHDNSYNRFRINTPATSTIDFRAFDGTANCGLTLVGVHPYWRDPNANGILVLSAAVNSSKLHTAVAPAAGDPFALFDNVKLGTGSPPAHSPNSGVILMQINDSQTAGADTSVWAADITTFQQRMSLLGPVAFVNPWEGQLLGIFSTAIEAAYRAMTLSIAAGLPVSTLDHYALDVARGFTGWQQMMAQGQLVDGLHETQEYHRVVWQRMFGLVRSKFLAGWPGSLAFPAASTGPVLASSAVRTIAGKAALPLSLR